MLRVAFSKKVGVYFFDDIGLYRNLNKIFAFGRMNRI
jgi:hypothetical protein